MARRMMSRYFQLDDDDARVPLAELQGAIASYDANGDGVLQADEFRARAEASKVTAPGDDSRMVQRFMDGMDPWETIAAAVDADGSGSMSSQELVAFHAKMAEGSGAWELAAMTGGGGATRAEPEQKSGPAVGSMAPDFILEPLDGKALVRLSSFRGERPVALVFGSYT